VLIETLAESGFYRRTSTRRGHVRNRTRLMSIGGLRSGTLEDVAREAVADLPSEQTLQIQDGEYDLLALNEALERLEQIDARLAELVKLRFFSGLPIPTAAKVLGISASTAITDWAYARGWLRLELSDK
jgi:DNA-directed RNA polymerase specialized sigma24 family protein